MSIAERPDRAGTVSPKCLRQTAFAGKNMPLVPRNIQVQNTQGGESGEFLGRRRRGGGPERMPGMNANPWRSDGRSGLAFSHGGGHSRFYDENHSGQVHRTACRHPLSRHHGSGAVRTFHTECRGNEHDCLQPFGQGNPGRLPGSPPLHRGTPSGNRGFHAKTRRSSTGP